ncbi:MAG: hypothetical protein SCARUB_04122 [Candidatus Scalindua rubra]|uniref:Uncharacterized protein n=1 Tax=Candidatus Scalindua rubra TaxID=1872076 RepID=A0A1E3X545_9BACT|nr:MAG: hypothetical protein SCARUB_04122 [Candidatus Scalindua rubra]
MLSKKTLYFLPSLLIKIILSICLLAIPLLPGATIFISEKGAYSREHHTCRCTTAPDFLGPCCCVKMPNALEMNCSLKENSKDTLSTFIQSLACSGTPDQFTAVLDTIRLPEDSIFIPDLYLFCYLKAIPSVFPVSLLISPPDKPPRII